MTKWVACLIEGSILVVDNTAGTAVSNQGDGTWKAVPKNQADPTQQMTINGNTALYVHPGRVAFGFLPQGSDGLASISVEAI